MQKPFPPPPPPLLGSVFFFFFFKYLFSSSSFDLAFWRLARSLEVAESPARCPTRLPMERQGQSR